jgi:predicted DCC family thiol-disulfide oxidoreductase YuxK
VFLPKKSLYYKLLFLFNNLSMKILLFDGVCNLCNEAVQFVIAHDHKGEIQFAALQSEFAQNLLRKHALPTDTLDSLVFIDDGVAYTSSSGALRLARSFAGAWRLLYAFIVVPKFIRDAVYRFVGANRYRWFGRQAACMLPTPALKARFLG